MLGIFQHKKAQYNKLILKSLVGGFKTTTQIAEYIYLNRKSAIKPSKLNKNKVKKIISIISRKGSRLHELETKLYIQRKDRLWQLTAKGMGLNLTFSNNITEILPYFKPFIHSVFEDVEKTINEHPMLQFLRKNDTITEAIKKTENFIESHEFLQLLKDTTDDLVRQGVDLDKTNHKDFLSMLMGKFITVYLPKALMKEVLSHE